MTLLSQTCEAIRPIDESLRTRVFDRFCAKAGDNTGLLAELVSTYGAIRMTDDLTIPKKCMILAVGDHGVSELGISAYPIETTVEMTKNYLIAHGAGANALANFAHADMVVVDVGIASDVSTLPDLRHAKIAYGTQNFTHGPAMTREQAIRSLEIGIRLVKEKAAEGYHSFTLGEMGIGNTTSSAAICAAFTGLSAEEVTGRGTGISDARMRIKTQAVCDALRVNRPDPTDGIDVLMKVGGFELGCLAGAILGAAFTRSIVVIDGFNATAAAMIATAISPHVRDYMIGSHLSAEKAHCRMLEYLHISPCIDMGLRLGEGTGASIAQAILDSAIHLYTDNTAPTEYCVTLPTTLPDTDETIRAILELNETERERCRLLIDNLSKPLGSLCALEHMASRLAGIRGEMRPTKEGKQLLYVFASTVSPAIRSMAHYTKTSIAQIDITHQADSIAYGIYLADRAASDGIRMIGLAGHDLSSVDTMTGIILGAAKNRIAVFLDDLPSLTAAKRALRSAPLCRDYLFTAHLPQEKSLQNDLLQLGLPMYLRLTLSAANGLGALFGFLLMHAALHMLNDMKTFGEANVTIAKDGPGTMRQRQEIKGDTI